LIVYHLPERKEKLYESTYLLWDAKVTIFSRVIPNS